MKLYDTGVYLHNGKEIIPAAEAQLPVSREDAARNTIAYSILKAHNTSGNMDKLQIKFDKLTSHDITFVGIIQTARASGLERFPVPYVWSYLCEEIRRCLCSASSGSYPSVCPRNAC